jgi:hypothetical protein
MSAFVGQLPDCSARAPVATAASTPRASEATDSQLIGTFRRPRAKAYR